MRKSIATILLLASLAFAGCLDGDSDPKTEESQPTNQAPEGQNETFPFEALIEYCPDEDNCDFWDEQYHGYVVYDLDTISIDALVVPVPGADPMSNSNAAKLATDNWGTGLLNLTAPWFQENWTMQTYLLGVDTPTTEAATDPEIIVISESGQRSTSIGLNAEQVACSVIGNGNQLTMGLHAATDGPLANYVYPVHEHDGMAIMAADCVSGGFRCVALNFASALGGNNYLYDLVAHEVGHCLGLGHVGDALDFNARYVPTKDIMSYAVNPSQVPCVSTLNARVAEGIYGHLLDRPQNEWLPDSSYYHMDPWDFAQVDCPNPPPAILD